MKTNRKNNKGFTLVEILIVVIILGILAAIVIPQFTNASTDARKNSLTSQLQTIRSQVELYKLQHNDTLPAFAAQGWAQMTGQTDVSGTVTAGAAFGPYLQQTPVNSLNNNTTVAVVTGADPVLATATAPGTATGFVVNTDNGKIWATNQSDTAYYDESTGIIR